MTISIIIVTYNRPLDVVAMLGSLLRQTLLPTEIIVVDNCPNTLNSPPLLEMISKSKAAGVDVRQYKSQINSLPCARNIGVSSAHGDILFFLDDDVVLAKDYVREVVAVYEGNKSAMGVQGLIEEEPPGELREFLHKIFFWYHHEYGKGRVLASCSATYPYPSEKVVETEWLSGANHSYRKEVFRSEKYDENLMKYADGEDLDMSYRVYMRYPGSLYFAPKARLIHKTSAAGRTIGTELIFMREVYGLYLFFKLFRPTFANCSIYIWSRFGRLLFSLVNLIRQPSSRMLRESWDLLRAYRYCFVYIDLISAGDLRLFNSSLSGRKGNYDS